jgi:flagellar hook protein FlgE
VANTGRLDQVHRATSHCRDLHHARGLKSGRAPADMPRVMSSSFSIGMSGMRAAQTRLDVAGHHIANSATPDFQRQRVVAASLENGGVRADVQPAGSQGEDLAADLVAQRQAQHLFTANLRTVQTADRMLGALLDTFA